MFPMFPMFLLFPLFPYDTIRKSESHAFEGEGHRGELMSGQSHATARGMRLRGKGIEEN